MASIDLYEAMSTLRAVRRLRPDPIPDEVLHRVLQAATWAPSGGNVQPWRVVVVRDAKKRAALGDLYRPEWAKYSEGVRRNMQGLEGDARADRRDRALLAARAASGPHHGYRL